MRPRRSALRTVSKRATLAQRRSHFERLVHHNLAERKSTSSSSLWEFDSNLAAAQGPVSCDPEDIRRCTSDTKAAPHVLCAVLNRLREISNDTSSDEESETLDDAVDGNGDDDKAGVSSADDKGVLDLQGLARVLASDNFIAQGSHEVRVFTACSLAEILRITAPKPPLPSSKLKAVSNLFIDELSVIAFADDHLRGFRFSLLEQLAAVKAFAIFSNEEHVVADIFACFYAAVRSFQPEKYKEHLGFILHTMLTEVETIGQPLLDALLAPLAMESASPLAESESLLKEMAHYSPSAVELASFVVKSAKNLLQVPICNFLNSALQKLSKGRLLSDKQKLGSVRRRDARTNTAGKNDLEQDHEHESSELLEHIENLFVSVYKVAPGILIFVIPSLEERLRAKDPIVRRNIARLLGLLFTSSTESSVTYSSLFSEFIHRSRDVDYALRAEVCRTLGPLIVSMPSQRDTLNKALVDRVLDQHELVRETVAISVGRTKSFASTELILCLASRLRDKKQSVRRETFRQLSSLLKVQLMKVQDAKLLPVEAENRKESDEPDVEVAGEIEFSKYSSKDTSLDVPGWMCELPNVILNSRQALLNFEDDELVNSIDKFLFEEMHVWDSDLEQSDDLRVRRFAAFLGSLDNRCLVCFSSLIARRAKVVLILLKICDLRLEQNNVDSSGSRSGEEIVTELISSVREVKKTFGTKESSLISPHNNDENESSVCVTGDLLNASNLLASLLGHGSARNGDTQELCWKISNFADRKLFEQLRRALMWSSTSEEAISACQEVISRLSSKSALGEFMSSVVLPSCWCPLFSVRHLQSAYRIVEELYGQNSTAIQDPANISFAKDNDILCGTLRYVELVSIHFPDIFTKVQTQAFDVFSKATDESLPVLQVLMCGLKAFSRVEWSKIDDTYCSLLLDCFRGLMVAPVMLDAKLSSTFAKWATRALIQLCKSLPSSKDVWRETISMLRAQLTEHADDAKQLVSAYSSLTQLAKHNSEAFKAIAVEAFDQARFLIWGSHNERLTSRLDLEVEMNSDDEERSTSLLQSFWQSSFMPSSESCRIVCTDGIIPNLYLACLTELCSRAIKLMVYTVHAMDLDEDDFSDILRVLHNAAEIRKGDIFGLRQSFLNETGEEVNDEEVSLSNPAVVNTWNVVRLCCSCGVLYLARCPKSFKRLSPLHLNWALLCTQDQNPDIRIAFARSLQRYVLLKGLPFRWICALALVAVDPDKDNVIEVRDMLSTSLRRKRNSIRTKLQNSTMTSLRRHLPEVTVPVLIWLIAKHPDPDDVPDFFGKAERMLEFLIDRLLDSNEYAAVINEYLDALAVAMDRTEREGSRASTARIHKLAQLCSVLLKKKQAGKKWNLLDHPGNVQLPGDLFRKKEKTAASTIAGSTPTLLDAAKKFDSANTNKDDTFHVEQKRARSSLEDVPPGTIETPSSVQKMRRKRRRRTTECNSDAGSYRDLDVVEEMKVEETDSAKKVDKTPQAISPKPRPRRSSRRKTAADCE